MKLSDDTINVLKNFSGINQSLQFKAGNTLRTISPLKTIFVEFFFFIQRQFVEFFAHT